MICDVHCGNMKINDEFVPKVGDVEEHESEEDMSDAEQT